MIANSDYSLNYNAKTLTIAGQTLDLSKFGVDTSKVSESDITNYLNGVDLTEFHNKFLNEDNNTVGTELGAYADVPLTEEEMQAKLAQLSQELGVNGEIDAPVVQGVTGDCWLLSGVLALQNTEKGADAIKKAINVNPDGSVTVKFAGIGASYNITPEEIKKYDTDDNKDDKYSNGDNDMLVLELAVNKLFTDMHLNKVNIPIDEEKLDYITYNSIKHLPNLGIDSGDATQIIYYLTGSDNTGRIDSTADIVNQKTGETHKKWSSFNIEEIYNYMNSVSQEDDIAVGFGLRNNFGHQTQLTNGENYSVSIQSGHAFAITNVSEENKTVTFVNPWDSEDKKEVSWDNFANLNIQSLSWNKLGDTDVNLDSRAMKIYENGIQNNTDRIWVNNFANTYTGENAAEVQSICKELISDYDAIKAA